MEPKGGEVGADEETEGLKLPSMSDPPVLTEQPLEPELLELIEEGDAETDEGDDGHKMKILSAIDETSGGVEYGKSGALDEFAKQFHHWLRLFMMVPFVVPGDRIRAQAAQYHDLHVKLQQVRIPVSYEMYVSSSLLYSTVAGIIGAILGLIISFVVIEVIGLPDKITKLTFSESTAWLIDYKWIFLSLHYSLLKHRARRDCVPPLPALPGI
ncbi:MAG: hypothetical protein U9N09_00265 [Euryarchaeota archaeon]|nr:hypothetical protein [Euryarchaeota archaeon]